MRIAGDSPTYQFRLIDSKGNITPFGFDFPSATHILKAVMGASAGGMSYWGFKLGIRSQHPKLSDEQIDELYERAKKGRWSPNKVRDAGGDRGTSAHNYLDALAKQAMDVELQSRGQDVVPSPVPPPANGYEDAVFQWFHAEGLAHNPSRIVASELPVWHLSRRYSGQFDLLLRTRDHADAPMELVDLKTHAPAKESDGAAYEMDLLQLAGYEGAVLDMTPTDERPSHLEHRVLLAQEDGSCAEDRRYIGPDVFYEIVDVYQAIRGAKLNGR